MSKSVFLVIALVLNSISVSASPIREAPPPATQESEPETGRRLDPNMSVAAPTPDPDSDFSESEGPVDPGYYAYQQALTFRLGLASATDAFDPSQFIIGFQYLLPKFLSPKFEIGADAVDQGRGHVFGGVRWIGNERGFFRPSAKLSVDHLFEGSKGLSTLAHHENYFVRASATLEWVVAPPTSLRLELEGLANVDTSLVVLTIGATRNW